MYKFSLHVHGYFKLEAIYLFILSWIYSPKAVKEYNELCSRFIYMKKYLRNETTYQCLKTY
jgi:hypothetical protein